MVDQFDRAQELQLRQIEDAHRRARLPDCEVPPSSRACRSCGEPIPQARLRLVPHADQCVSCAEIGEARVRHIARPRA